MDKKSSQKPSKGNPAPSEALWFWKSNPDPFKKAEDETWEEYTEDDNIKIETAFAKKELKADIGDYIIQFKDMTQYNKNDGTKQRPVKRVEGAEIQLSKRTQRFMGPLPDIKKKTMSEAFGNIKHFIDLLEKKAHNAYPELIPLRHVRYRKFSKNEEKSLIAATIIKSIHQEADAILKDSAVQFPGYSKLPGYVNRHTKQIEKKIQHHCQIDAKIPKEFDKIWTEFCIGLIKSYTIETWLYKRLNQLLREENWNGLTNLAPFAYYLMQAIVHIYKTQKFDLKSCEIADKKEGFIKFFDKPLSIFLYRGAALPDDLIMYYDPAKTKYFSWNAFISTSKLKDVAKNFAALGKREGTVSAFFKIEAKVGSRQMADITSVSDVESEKEVVLVPGTIFQVIDFQKNGEQYEISLRVVEDVDKVKAECVNLRGPAIISLEDVKHSIRIKEAKITLKGLADQELDELIGLLTEGNDFIKAVDIHPLVFSLDGTKKIIEALCKLQNLKTLDLKDNSFSIEILEFMASVLPSSSVQALSLGLFETNVVEGAQHYEFIFKALYKSLSTLQFDGEIYNELDKEVIASIWQALPQSGITKLTLSHLKVTSTFIEQVKNSFENSIQELVLENIDLEEKDTDLALKLSQLNLKKLHFTIPPYKDLGAFYKKLGQGLQKSSISELTLQGASQPPATCTISPILKKAGLTEGYYYEAILDEFEVLSSYLPQTNISALVINNVWMTVQGLVKFLNILPKTKINTLYLGLSLFPSSPGEKAMKITKEYAQMLVDFSNVIDMPTMETVRSRDERVMLETLLKVLPSSKVQTLGINFKDAAEFELNHDETKKLDEFIRSRGITKYNISE